MIFLNALYIFSVALKRKKLRDEYKDLWFSIKFSDQASEQKTEENSVDLHKLI